jgi:hypothetical protein
MSDEIILTPKERVALQLIPENSGWRVAKQCRHAPTSIDVSTEAGRGGDRTGVRRPV